MNIAISGATGFIGSNLTRYFEQKGYKILPISRQILSLEDNVELKRILNQADVVVNLAGAPINRLWTKAYKKKLYDSRILPTRRLVTTINEIAKKPKLFISTSAIGYYSTEGCNTESDGRRGEGFLAELCEAWENEASRVDTSVRLVIARLGVVLFAKGGAFEQMIFSTKFKVAVAAGDRDHLLSWINIADLMAAVDFLINNAKLKGVINFVAPQSVTNAEMVKSIGRVYKCPIKIVMPSFFFRCLLGESADFMINSPCAFPSKLIESGFGFKTPTFQDFLKDVHSNGK